ncbi:hypothetical protein [Nocardia sp. NPDC058633]|uniref:hypothetical protein n=1 Tax=Nocardia sp. NPDC058633 TaxID=3346568 RepID=UPI00366A31F2
MTRTFEFHRDADVSGVSGTGVVADGIVFDDGHVALRWRGERRSTVTWSSVEDAIAVHGHDGKTRLVWTDLDDPTVTPLACGCTAVLPFATGEPIPRTGLGRPLAVVDPAELARANASIARAAEFVDELLVDTELDAHTTGGDPMFAGLLGHLEKAIVEGALSTDAQCRSCKAPVAWRNSNNGKRTPIDPIPSDTGNVLVVGGHCGVLTADQIANARGAGDPLYTSHFATCPDADAWRSKGGDRG